jgi:hypothetical protein
VVEESRYVPAWQMQEESGARKDWGGQEVHWVGVVAQVRQVEWQRKDSQRSVAVLSVWEGGQVQVPREVRMKEAGQVVHSEEEGPVHSRQVEWQGAQMPVGAM